METNMAIGMTLVIFGGILSGIFAVPFKLNQKWAWENNWLLWSFMALIIMPWSISLLTVPHLFGIYQQLPDVVTVVLLFGMLWGIGAILWGRGMEYLGIAVSVPIMAGLANSIGTIMPIIMRNPSELWEPNGLKIIAGVFVLLFGIIVCSLAVGYKEKAVAAQSGNPNRKSRFIPGLIICLLSGLIGPLINIGFVYGKPLQDSAIQNGVSLTASSNAIWSVVLTGGFVANFLYCLYLLKRNKTIVRFKNVNFRYWMFALLAGVIWYLSIMFYGMGSSNLGKTGASVGWATMQSLSIIAANFAGLLSGEWKGADKKSLTLMFAGLGLLIIGILIIAT